MMCQNCGKNPATTHIKTIVNGKLAEYDLCSECARAKGYKSFFNFDDMDFDFNNLLGSFIGAPTGRSNAMRCPKCGASFEEHKGKVPGSNALRIVEPAGKIAVVEEPTPIEKKRAELKEAIEKQDFEHAAELRDEIKEMEKGDGNHA